MSDQTKPATKPDQVNLQLQMDDDIAQGKYVNFAIVNHTATEFVLDFVFVQPQQPRGKVTARVITSPLHAKRMAMALQENIKRFEQRFGAIQVPAVNLSDPVVH